MDEVLLEAPSSLRGIVEKCSEEGLLLDLDLVKKDLKLFSFWIVRVIGKRTS